MARLYETFTVFCLLGLVVLGMTYVISALIDKDKSSIQTILSKLVTGFPVLMWLLIDVFYRFVELLFAFFVLMHIVYGCANSTWWVLLYFSTTL